MSANIYQLARLPVIKRPQGYYLRWWYNGWHYWHFLAGGLTLTTRGEAYRTYGQRSVKVSSGMITLAQAAAIRTITNSTEVYIYTDSGWRLVRLITSTMQISNNFFNGYEIQFALNIGSRLISVTGFSPVADVPVTPPVGYCEVVIGEQIWMCRNWDAAYPDSKVYMDSESNREAFGGLYRGTQVLNAGFAPEGWHLPTQAEWETLFNYVAASWVTAGKELKAAGTDYWSSPNSGLDSAGFGARGGGYYNAILANFFEKFESGYFWTATPNTTHTRFAIQMKYNGDYAMVLSMPSVHYCSVRFLKNVAASILTMLDKDGNTYNIITIGSQQWTVEPLRTTQFASGRNIPRIVDNASGSELITGWLNDYPANAFDVFSSSGKDILDAQAITDDPALCRTLPFAVVAGEVIEWVISITITAGTTVDLFLISDAGDNEYYYDIVSGTHRLQIQVTTNSNMRCIIRADAGTTFYATCEAHTLGWVDDVTGARCSYNDDSLNDEPYGILYNWHALNHPREELIDGQFTEGGSPSTGWRAPTAADIAVLAGYLGGDSIAGGALKEAGLAYWTTPNTGATNSSSFRGRPAGYRDNAGAYSLQALRNLIWTASEIVGYGIGRELRYNDAAFTYNNFDKANGMTVRMLRDI